MSFISSKYVVIGCFGKPHGLKGWLKVHSKTETKEDILKYKPWLLMKQARLETVNITGSMFHNETLLVHVEGYDSPESAKELTGAVIQIDRELLPKLAENKFYWADLEGLNVIDTHKHSLGWVSHFIEAGACDVMVVKSEKSEFLIPFDQKNVIKKVDLKAGFIEADWDPDF